jgi:soluble lytic murein transglycosylase
MRLDKLENVLHSCRMMRWVWAVGAILLVAGVVMFAKWWHYETIKPHQFDRWIQEASNRYSIDPELVRAVIWRESDFNPRMKGTHQERGLMQVTPVTGKEWAKAEKLTDFQDDDLFLPRANILAGSWYLSRALARWAQMDQPEIFALAEYNAGRSNALRWARQVNPVTAPAFVNEIDYPSTKRYVVRIERRYQLYRAGRGPTPLQLIYDKICRKLDHWLNRS